MAKHKWIKGAIKHPGSFKAKAEKAGKSTRAYAAEKANAPGTLGKQARLAENLMNMRGAASPRANKRYAPKTAMRG